MLNSKEADFILRGDGEIIYPEIAKNGLEVYYDVKGKKNGDVHKDKLLDMSGQGKDGVLSGFDYDGELSGYDGDNGLVFDGVDDTLTTPKLSDINLNNFTYQLNNNILAFTENEVKTVKNGDVEVSRRNYFVVANMKPRQPIISSRRYYTFKVEPNQLHTLSVYGAPLGASVIVDEASVSFSRARGGYQFSSNSDGIVTVSFWRNEDLPFIDGTAKFKLEKGNTVTDWTHAPEDLLETTDLKGNILGDMEDIVDASPRDLQSGKEVFTEHADDSHVEVEVDGQSYQHAEPTPDSPIEIESVNDFDVVSAAGGRNLVLNSNNIIMNGSDDGNYNLAVKKSDYISITPTNSGNVYANGAVKTSLERVQGETYTISLEVNTLESTGMYWYPSNRKTFNGIIPNTNGEWAKISHTYTQSGETKSGNGGFLWGFNRLTAGNEIKYRNLKLEKGTTATPYTPAPEGITEDSGHPLIDKINLLLSEPLRSVGDVHDRLFRDSDGLWKVERNVGGMVLNGDLNWRHHRTSTTEIDYYETALSLSPMVHVRKIESTHFSGTLTQNHYPVNHIRMSRSGLLQFSVKHGTFNEISELTDWLDNNHIIVNYEVNPEIEILDQELQDQLNTLKSFKDSNYVYTVNNMDSPYKEQLKPTLHATFNSKDYLKETRTLTNLLIWARELTDEELIHHNRLFLNRFNLPSDRVVGEPIEQTLNLLHGGMVGHSLEQNYTINI